MSRRKPTGFRRRKHGSQNQIGKAFPVYGRSSKRLPVVIGPKRWERPNVYQRVMPEREAKRQIDEIEEEIDEEIAENAEAPVLIVNKEEQKNEEPNVVVVRERDEDGEQIKEPHVIVQPRKKGIFEQLSEGFAKIGKGWNKMKETPLKKREEDEE